MALCVQSGYQAYSCTPWNCQVRDPEGIEKWYSEGVEVVGNGEGAYPSQADYLPSWVRDLEEWCELSKHGVVQIYSGLIMNTD